MRADNTVHLLAAARRRRDTTLARALEAITLLADGDQSLTVARLAEQARVSRSWIYTQPELLQRIDELASARPAPSRRPPPVAAHAASVASLRRRLDLAHERIKQLSSENRRLSEELAAVYGRLRATKSGADTD